MKKIIIIAGVLGVSFSAIFVRYAEAPSMVLVFYRTFFAALLLAPVVFFRHREELGRLGRKEWILSMVSGAFLGIHFTAYFQAVKWTSIASAVVLTDIEVFFVAFAMLFFFKDRIPGKGWTGILVTFAGSILIAVTDLGGGSHVIAGDGLAVSAALSMAVYTMIGSVLRKTMSTWIYTFFVYLSAALTVLCMLFFTGTPVTGYQGRDYLMALGMTVFCTLLGHSIFSWGLKYEKASFVSVVKLLEPVFATILGIILFTEIPGIWKILGGFLVITGILIYSLGRKNSTGR